MKHTEEIFVRTLSPIHVGGSKEKDKIKDLDFIVENGVIHFINEQKLIDDFGLQKYISSLERGDIKGLMRSTGIEKFTSKSQPIYGEVGVDLKEHIKEGFSNKVYIPGSSLKGALRSIIINKIGLVPNNRNGRQEEPFGNTSEDAFRFLQVGDAFFEKSKLINTKTFNLKQGSAGIVGGWKQGGQTIEEFDSKGFVFSYECIVEDQISSFQMSLNHAGYSKSNAGVKKHEVLDEILSSFQNLFLKIQSYTRTYLEAEIAFFEKYENQETDVIIEQLEIIKAENEKAPVLRVGQGSGFHSITGGVHFQNDHSIDGLSKFNRRTNRRTSRGQLNGRDSAKSRKLAFDEVNDELIFYPMGFVQLLTQDEHGNLLEQLKHEQEDKRLKLIEEAKEEHKRAKEKERFELDQERERLAPKMTALNVFKKNAILIDAIVVEYKNRNLIVKPQIKGFEDQSYSIPYPNNDFGPGAVVQILMRLSKKKTLQHEGRPKLKK